MITNYDPQQAPDPAEWLALDETERIDLVWIYHHQAGEDMPNMTLHSTIHVLVENQIALGDEYPVNKTLTRLILEGLDRHDAIHAIGSVLINYIWEIGNSENTAEDFSQHYLRELNTLTAQQWLDELE